MHNLSNFVSIYNLFRSLLHNITVTFKMERSVAIAKWMKLLMVSTCLISVTQTAAVPRPKASKQTVVIMLDGFRADYASRADPDDVPTFARFAREGVKADYVQPIYPSISMPSWTTIVTGHKVKK